MSDSRTNSRFTTSTLASALPSSLGSVSDTLPRPVKAKIILRLNRKEKDLEKEKKYVEIIEKNFKNIKNPKKIRIPQEIWTRSVLSQQRAARDDPNKFVYFPLLPPEIRHMVWNYSRTPRFLRLSLDKDKKIFSNQHIPAILHACQESRTIGLKHYRLAFGIMPGTSGLFAGATDDNMNARTYFDFENDGLIGSCTETHKCTLHKAFYPIGLSDDQKLVKRILWIAPMGTHYLWPVSKMFRGCEELLLMRVSDPQKLLSLPIIKEEDLVKNHEELFRDRGVANLNEWWQNKQKMMAKVTVKSGTAEMTKKMGTVRRVELISKKQLVDGYRVTIKGERVLRVDSEWEVEGDRPKFGPLREDGTY